MNLPEGGRPVDMLDDSPPDEVDERLVAYLDGELEPEDRRALEVQLGRSAALRARLRSLQDGWELLDELPMATPSPQLLESTLRMAATEAASQPRPLAAVPNRWAGRLQGLVASKIFWVSLLSAVGFASGVVLARVRSDARFERQLRLLPVAMQVDAYLHGEDLELMRSLLEMPQWQQAVAIADQLGEWDLTLPRTLAAAPLEQRQEILPHLPIEHQQEVLEAWQRFEQLDPQAQAVVEQRAVQVAQQPDAERLLATMNRFALWRQSLLPPQRDRIVVADPQRRRAAIAEELQRTTRQWTQQSSRMLSGEDFETIYQAVRQIARLRIQRLDLDPGVAAQQALGTFGTPQQAMSPWAESRFLRRLFVPPEEDGARDGVEPPRSPPPSPAQPGGREGRGRPAGPRGLAGPGGLAGRGGPGGAGAPPAPRFDLGPTFRDIQSLVEQIQGPLEEYELWMIESVLSGELTDFLAAASAVPMLREDLVHSWVDDAIRRTSSRRSGGTLSERYELIDPARRDQLDLLPPAQILDSLRDEDRRRR